MSNADTAQFDLSQFGSWYLLAGIECYLESCYEVLSAETLLFELDRLEAWEQEHGGYYSYDYVPARFAELRERITAARDWLQDQEDQYYSERFAAECREKFTVIEGGLSGNNSQSGIN